MIEAFDTWHREPCDGGIVLRSPAGDGQIRVRPRVDRPVRPRHLLDELVAAWAGVPDSIEHAPLQELVTAEGELAIVARAQLRARGRVLACTVAIAGDEPCACIDAIGAPAHHALAMSLIETLGLGLGASRPRWFRYEPPAGWLGLRRGPGAVWLHPRYPRVRARITVLDARPFRDGPDEQRERRWFAGLDEPFTATSPETLEDLHGDELEGRLRVVHGHDARGLELVRAAAALADDRFAYLAHLEAPADAAQLAVFRRVVASFRRVTSPRPALVAPIWVD